MSKKNAKRITLDPSRKSHARKLAALLEDGWVIVSQHKRSIMSWKPGWVDYTLVRPQ